MMRIYRLFTIALAVSFCLSTASIQAQAPQSASVSTGEATQPGAATVIDLSTLLAQSGKARRRGFTLRSESNTASAGGPALSITPLAAGPSLPVTGGGTLGRLTKWTGFTSGNSVIGDSSIYEDKFGNVTIGTGVSTVTIAGTVQASGGTTVAHDTTLQGNGTAASPLMVAVPLVLSGAVGIAPAPSGPIAVVQAANTTNRPGVIGITEAASPLPFTVGGVVGRAVTAAGVTGESSSGDGVSAFSFSGDGVFTRSNSTDPTRAAIHAQGADSGTGAPAGIFKGNVRIESGIAQAGDLTVAGKLQVTSGMKMFHIDHPLDPENKYLNHAAVESSEVLNIYSGNVTTDASGNALVQLPQWFAALNNDFRYQLTVVGTFAQAIIAEKIKNNRFVIKTDAPNIEVSWQVMGVRSDPTARKYRFDVEEEKAERDRGYYLNPDAYGQPDDRAIQNPARQPGQH